MKIQKFVQQQLNDFYYIPFYTDYLDKFPVNRLNLSRKENLLDKCVS